MGLEVWVVSSNIALWNYMDEPEDFTYKYIGHIGEYFNIERSKIEDKDIKQFFYIDKREITIFGYEQVKCLEREVEILERKKLFKKEALEVIKNGIVFVLMNKALYLKFEYD